MIPAIPIHAEKYLTTIAARRLPAPHVASHRTSSVDADLAAFLRSSATESVVDYVRLGALLLAFTQPFASTETKIRPLLLAGFALMSLAACGTSCQDIVNQYEQEGPAAQICDPTIADSCSLELPLVVGQENANGTFIPETLAADCNAGFNPARAAKLQALYSQFQAQGCKTETVPICGNPNNTSQCVQTMSAATCVNGGG